MQRVSLCNAAGWKLHNSQCDQFVVRKWGKRELLNPFFKAIFKSRARSLEKHDLLNVPGLFDQEMKKGVATYRVFGRHAVLLITKLELGFSLSELGCALRLQLFIIGPLPRHQRPLCFNENPFLRTDVTVEVAPKRLDDNHAHCVRIINTIDMEKPKQLWGAIPANPFVSNPGSVTVMEKNQFRLRHVSNSVQLAGPGVLFEFLDVWTKDRVFRDVVAFLRRTSERQYAYKK